MHAFELLFNTVENFYNSQKVMRESIFFHHLTGIDTADVKILWPFPWSSECSDQTFEVPGKEAQEQQQPFVHYTKFSEGATMIKNQTFK